MRTRRRWCRTPAG
uniref:Uncharacterized protein n=1 Tax=Macrostomum lignano TaxID=282301 RepID=A0A1I8I327_9PLAT